MSDGPVRRMGHHVLCRRAHRWSSWMFWSKRGQRPSMFRRCLRCPAVQFTKDETVAELYQAEVG